MKIRFFVKVSKHIVLQLKIENFQDC